LVAALHAAPDATGDGEDEEAAEADQHGKVGFLLLALSADALVVLIDVFAGVVAEEVDAVGVFDGLVLARGVENSIGVVAEQNAIAAFGLALVGDAGSGLEDGDQADGCQGEENDLGLHCYIGFG